MQHKNNMVEDTIFWMGVQTSSKKTGTCLRRVLRELVGAGLLYLRDPRLQVAVLSQSVGSGEVWAYFPVHRRRWITSHVELKSTTRILLVICASGVESRACRETEEELRHHTGHVLRYLAHPTLSNECKDADREWKKWTKQRPGRIAERG